MGAKYIPVDVKKPTGRPPKIYIDQKFNRLTIINQYAKFDQGKNSVIWFTCVCDCGTIKDIRSSHVKDGNTQSCGCLTVETNKKLNSIGHGEANANILFLQYRKQAIKRRLVFEITREDLKFFAKQNCHYCGSCPSNVCNRPSSNGAYTYPGIDRINSNVGYIISNLVPCCGMCNRAKLDFSVEEFEQWINRLVKHRNGLHNG